MNGNPVNLNTGVHNTKLPFCWLSTRKVCQRWSAHFATLGYF